MVSCSLGVKPKALRVLCRAGLSDVFAVLNSPRCLSEGQQYRYRLTKALLSGRQFLFADEFGCSLDRGGAGVLAFQMRQAMQETGRILFAASCQEGLETKLEPDVIVRKDISGGTEVIYPGRGKLHSGSSQQRKNMLPAGRAVRRQQYAGEGKHKVTYARRRNGLLVRSFGRFCDHG